MDLNEFRTVRQLVARNPDVLSEGAVRWQIFNAKQNGLEDAGAIVRVGRKVLLHEPRYVSWLTSNPNLGRR